MELVVNFSAKMLFDDFCLKIYFWPFLTYLANIKGICPTYPPPPISPFPPTPFSTIPTIPTYQPTPPLPTITTTLPPCPSVPLVCLANGERPIAYCPCIDPRQQMSSQLQQQPQPITSQSLIYQPISSQQQQIHQPLVASQLMIGQSDSNLAIASHTVLTDQPMTSSQLMALQQQMNEQQISSQPMTSDQLVELLDVQSLELRKGSATQKPSGSEMMIFAHLPGSKRRKRRYVEH